MNKSKLRGIRENFENAPCGMHSLDRQGVILYINKAECSWLGYEQDELIGKTIDLIIPDLSLEDFKNRIDKFIELKKFENVEVAYQTKSGKKIYCLANSEAVFNSKGHYQYSKTILINITQNKLQEAEIKLKNLELVLAQKTLLEISKNIPGAIYIFKKDINGKMYFTYASDKIAEILGEPFEVLKIDATASFKHHHPEDFEIFIKSAEESEKNLTPWFLEYRINHPAKGVIWVEGHSIPEKLNDGSIVFYGFLQDITHKKALYQNTSLLESLVTNSYDAVISYNLEGRVVSWNKRAEDIFAISEERALGTCVSSYIPDFKLSDRKSFEQFLVKKRRSIITNIKKEVIYLDIMDSPILDRNENLIGYSKIARDVTEIVRAEQELELKNNYLLKNSKLTAMGELSAYLAHEINNPLAIVCLKIQKMIKQSDELNLKDSCKEELIKILDSSNRIAKVIRKMNDFCIDGKEENSDLNSIKEIVDHTILLCEEKIKNKQIKIETQVDDTSKISCRKNQVSQAILNLLLNSFHAIDGNEIIEDRWIKITYEEDVEISKIRIFDSGLMENIEKVKRILDENRPINPTEIRGVGLLIVKSIMAKHFGRLILDLNSSHTCFVLEFPKNKIEKIAA